MSRKPKSRDAVPEEILAEGSGPVADAIVEVEVIEAAPPEGIESDEIAPEVDATESEAAVEAAVEVEVEAIDAPDAPLTATTMEPAQLKHLVEALVFATDKPITLQRLRQLTRIHDTRRLEQALAELAADYADRGISLHQVSGGYQFRTNTSYSPWVQQLIAGRPVRLSRAQLETLAIIAYRQPITRPEIDEIRGVDSSATLRLLLDRALIRVLGKREEVGRPLLYGTTKEFLDFFSLSDLRELPTLREYSELTAESRQVISDRLGPAQDEAGEDSFAVATDAPMLDATGDGSVAVFDPAGRSREDDGAMPDVAAEADMTAFDADDDELDRSALEFGPSALATSADDDASVGSDEPE